MAAPTQLLCSSRGDLMVVARLIGGRADGWACPVPEGTAVAYVTMIDAVPKIAPLPGDPDGNGLLRRGRGHWELYRPIVGLDADERGRLGYWVTRPLHPVPAGPATLITGDLLADVERALESTGNPDRWAVLRQVLGGTGYVLSDPRSGA